MLSREDRAQFYNAALLNADSDAGCTFAGAGPGELFEMCAQRGFTPAESDPSWCDMACGWTVIWDPSTVGWPISYGTGGSTPMASIRTCILRTGLHPGLLPFMTRLFSHFIVTPGLYGTMGIVPSHLLGHIRRPKFLCSQI